MAITALAASLFAVSAAAPANAAAIAVDALTVTCGADGTYTATWSWDPATDPTGMYVDSTHLMIGGTDYTTFVPTAAVTSNGGVSTLTMSGIPGFATHLLAMVVAEIDTVNQTAVVLPVKATFDGNCTRAPSVVYGETQTQIDCDTNTVVVTTAVSTMTWEANPSRYVWRPGKPMPSTQTVERAATAAECPAAAVISVPVPVAAAVPATETLAQTGVQSTGPLGLLALAFLAVGAVFVIARRGAAKH